MMEGKKLNFSQPLLSVRRYAPTLTSGKRDERKTDISHPVIPRLPRHRLELKSGPITNPGAVPFVWEQTPGKPKEETKPRTQNRDRPQITPKLPPGRYRKANRQDSDRVSPSSSGSKNQAVNVPSTSDKDRENFNIHNENVKNVENGKDRIKEKESSDSGDSNAYVDAPDTFSRTDSFFLNCSMSGLGELDDVDVKLSGRFSTEPQTREFMMDRFLPAAKAMASETPHYAPKRQPVAQEQPKQPKKVVSQYKPSLRYGPSFAKRYSHYHDSEEEEEEDSDDNNDRHENLPAVCGLLPRFCIKSSLCLLNPVPAMSVRTRVPISSSNKLQPRSSSAGSYRKTDNEFRSDRTKVKSGDRVLTAELDDGSTKLRNDGGDSTSTHRGLPPLFLQEKEVPGCPEGQMNVGINDFELHGEGCKTFQELLADQGSPKESDPGFVVEKTLYIDTVQKVESPNLRSSSPDTQDIKRLPSSREEDCQIITERTDQTHAADLTAEESKKLNNVGGEEKLLPSTHKFEDFKFLPSSDKSNRPFQMEMPKAFGDNEDFIVDSTTTETIELEKEATDSLERQLQGFSQLPAPPPLPKSPSDSWLFRALPSVSTKNSPLRSHLSAAANPQTHGLKAPSNENKWETIVKTKTLQHRHLHHSAGLLTTIPED